MDSAAPGEVFRFKGAFPALVASALCVQRSSVVLVIAFVLLSGYTVVTTNGKEHGSMEQKKNLCAQVPLSFHAQVCEAREAAGQTTSEYITNLLIEYYNLKKNRGTTTMSGNTRTMAFQIPEELFQRIKAHLERETQRTGRKLTQREFVLNLIEEALIGVEAKSAHFVSAAGGNCVRSLASPFPTGTATEEDDSEEDLPPEKP